MREREREREREIYDMYFVVWFLEELIYIIVWFWKI